MCEFIDNLSERTLQNIFSLLNKNVRFMSYRTLFAEKVYENNNVNYIQEIQKPSTNKFV